MEALLAALKASVVTEFQATLTAGSPVLTEVSTTEGMFLGLPVFGAGVPTGALVINLEPLTLSASATANATASLRTGFRRAERRFRFRQDITEQPALFLYEPEEQIEWFDNLRPIHTMQVEAWIHTDAGKNPAIVPATALNNLLDALESAFAPDDPMRQRFTLGGLVHWCRPSGKVEKDPGDAGGQAIAVMDIEIIVP